MIFTRIARLKSEKNVKPHHVTCHMCKVASISFTYNSSTGRLRVMLPATVSPYLRYPKKPTPM